MPQVISFIGHHNSGKTTLIRKIARNLTKKNFKIGIIKSTKHYLCTNHKEGSDTWLYHQDGITDISIACPDGFVHFKPKDDFDLFYLAFSLFPQVDLLLCEGFKHAKGIKKIEVARKEVSTELLKNKVDGVIAVVADFEIKGVKSFRFEDVSKICDFMIESLNLSSQESFSIDLFVNKRRIPLKRFVRDSLKNTVYGYVQSLKFTENAKEIELRIKLSGVEESTK